MSFVIVLNITITTSFSQIKPTNLDRTINNISAGLMNSVELYDIPVGMAFLSAKYFPLTLGDDKLYFRKFSFDEGIKKNLSLSDGDSFGSTDPHRYPDGVFLIRMAYNVGKDLFTSSGSDADDYKHAFIFYKAVAYNYTITEFAKNLVHRWRPDRTDDRSFFSGHTSLAFVTSAFLFREIDDYLDNSSINREAPVLSKVLKVSSFTALYGWAGYVGYSRIYDKKHYFSDVLVGALVGTLVGNLVYDGYFSQNNSILSKISFGIRNQQPSVNFFYTFD